MIGNCSVSPCKTISAGAKTPDNPLPFLYPGTPNMRWAPPTEGYRVAGVLEPCLPPCCGTSDHLSIIPIIPPYPYPPGYVIPQRPLHFYRGSLVDRKPAMNLWLLITDCYRNAKKEGEYVILRRSHFVGFMCRVLLLRTRVEPPD